MIRGDNEPPYTIELSQVAIHANIFADVLQDLHVIFNFIENCFIVDGSSITCSSINIIPEWSNHCWITRTSKWKISWCKRWKFWGSPIEKKYVSMCYNLEKEFHNNNNYCIIIIILYFVEVDLQRSNYKQFQSSLRHWDLVKVQPLKYQADWWFDIPIERISKKSRDRNIYNSVEEQVIFYTFQLLFNCIGFCVLCYAFLSAASHIYSKQAQIQVGVTN